MSVEKKRIMNGELTLDDWDDEELLQGRRKDKNGRWRGRPPKLMPVAMVRELQKRRFARAHAILSHDLVDAVQFLGAVVRDKKAPRQLRLKAAREILNRVLGTPTESIRMNVSLDGMTTEPWEKMIAQAIVPTSDDVVEGEVVEVAEPPVANPHRPRKSRDPEDPPRYTRGQ